MNKVTIKIDGMACGMCEAHICDVIRRTFPDANKVKASRKTGEATFLTKETADERSLKKAIADTGYACLSVSSETYKKRGLFG
ncbi:MAG: heavy-metal-associated domain-containing protein [Clostridia bacterium]|nr:heavy-metal-associated domain-containing protein [Clostridia bacterium]